MLLCLNLSLYIIQVHFSHLHKALACGCTPQSFLAWGTYVAALSRLPVQENILLRQGGQVETQEYIPMQVLDAIFQVQALQKPQATPQMWLEQGSTLLGHTRPSYKSSSCRRAYVDSHDHTFSVE